MPFSVANSVMILMHDFAAQKQGTAGASFCSIGLQTDAHTPELENCIKWSASGIFQGEYCISFLRIPG